MVTCQRCGSENPERAKFCLECGAALAEAAPTPGREERKILTVLFADLVGFTSESERMDPEEVRAVLQPYHASLRADLERYGGTVEKFIGDAVMALFGAPTSHEDDPERAVRAAIAIRETLAADGRLHVRIGITTGEALVALEARPGAGEGMAAGDVVNTASRLQSVAPVDGILVDETTHRATSRRIEYRDHPPVSVKGKRQPIPVHEALSARARFGVDVRQIGQAPLVGRTRELDLLSGSFDRARSALEPQLVTLVGVPGIGKSRIVWELFQRIDAGDELVSWRQGRSLPYAEGISFWALGEMVKAEAGILETDTVDDAAGKLGRAVEALGVEPSDAEWMEGHLRPLVGLEPAAELHGDRRGEAFTAWRRFLEALAEQRPLVLIFEDLHWADDGLLDFVDHLVDWATGVPLLIVGTSRPELLSRRPGWGGGKPNALTISLAPLSDSETSRLVAALVERAVIPSSLHAAVLERAQGNPLYAEEFARLMAERGVLDDLPESVQGIISARLDGLTREEKELLQDAAVVGKVFWSGALAGMRERDRAVVDERLHALERREFVRRERRSSVAGETEYAFRHILVRDVAYGQIPRAQRADRHVKAAEWIESLGRPVDHAELLAQHYLAALELARAAGSPAAEYTERARSALRDAGERALSLNAFATAARYCSAALQLTPADDPDRPMLLFRYGKALRVSEEAGGDVLAEAEKALLAAGDPGRAAEAAVLQAELDWFAGERPKAAEHLTRAAALVGELPPSFSKAYVLSDLSRYHMLAAERDAAISTGREALAIADALGLDEIRAHALINVGGARAYGGDLEGIQDLERAVEIAEAINSPEVARALNNLAGAYDLMGQEERARQLWRAAAARAQELGNAAVARFVRPIIPGIDYDEGAWDEALAGYDEFIAEVETGKGHIKESTARHGRGRIRFARGDLAGALEDAERAVTVARHQQEPQWLGPAIGFAAWLAHRTGRATEANTFMDELVATAARGADVANVEGVIVLDAHGRQADIDRLVSQVIPGRWQDVFTAFAHGKYAEAVGVIEEMRLWPQAAALRLHAAEQLHREGRHAEAAAMIKKAVEFWRSVGATQLLHDAARLTEPAADVARAAARRE